MTTWSLLTLTELKQNKNSISFMTHCYKKDLAWRQCLIGRTKPQMITDDHCSGHFSIKCTTNHPEIKHTGLVGKFPGCIQKILFRQTCSSGNRQDHCARTETIFFTAFELEAGMDALRAYPGNLGYCRIVSETFLFFLKCYLQYTKASETAQLYQHLRSSNSYDYVGKNLENTLYPTTKQTCPI